MVEKLQGMTSVTQFNDGRRLRSERSRKSMIDAALELIEEGNFAPTAKQISARAGVGIRSFFRQFEDMDQFFAAVDEHTVGSFWESFLHEGDREGELPERLDSILATYAKAFEEHRSLLLATKSLRWSSRVLKANYERYQQISRANKERWLPEISQLPLDERELADAYLSFEMWHRLRDIQGLSCSAAQSVILKALTRLLSP
ncbi:MAG: TetR/AcrR family transcriptional regulator [Pseudomonadota bacterium]|nr:TetR/AcrR family transcriptional regulator [Pseudomonadota bacterium]